MDNLFFWLIGVIVWLMLFLWNVDAWNKSLIVKQKGLLLPVKSYWSEFALYVLGSLGFTVVLLMLVMFNQLPFKLVIGDDLTAGKLFSSAFVSLNCEFIVNAIRRKKPPTQ